MEIARSDTSYRPPQLDSVFKHEMDLLNALKREMEVIQTAIRHRLTVLDQFTQEGAQNESAGNVISIV